MHGWLIWKEDTISSDIKYLDKGEQKNKIRAVYYCLPSVQIFPERDLLLYEDENPDNKSRRLKLWTVYIQQEYDKSICPETFYLLYVNSNLCLNKSQKSYFSDVRLPYMKERFLKVP